ncbi:MAG: lamin tail domain-containing protein [Polyangiaceae bacterium]
MRPGRWLIGVAICAAALGACSSSPRSASPPPEGDDAGRAFEPSAGDPSAKVALGKPGTPGIDPESDGGPTETDAGSTTNDPTGLVLNEIDYDNVGTDDAEFVELYNGTGHALDLSGLALVLTTGTAEYLRVELSGKVAAGGYVVVADAGVTLAAGASGVVRIPFKAASNSLRNTGPAGVGILDVANGTLIDALAYGGSVTAAALVGVSDPADFSEGTDTSAVDSNTVDGTLARLPNGVDTDDSATDWKVSKTKTPGIANQP